MNQTKNHVEHCAACFVGVPCGGMREKIKLVDTFNEGVEAAALELETKDVYLPIEVWQGTKKDLVSAFALAFAEKIRELKRSLE